ncbi:hypothetical protein HUW51_14355 [Adhaeribacter swui]|uniref:Uncharacterized protein n=1 Tax=Adhaeribacter swui TaxID=2086471 RepID=A0A7G7G9L0_9BACT|nr:hypothetical protein [Adhaeribacter swui]QNF33844.1 hypothetical protein HUW51_14355 [Adhaeribacter swui]
MKISFILLAFFLSIHFKSQAQTNDLNRFLVRFKAFSMNHAPKVKSFMPLVNPGSNAAFMPNAIDTSKAYMEDPETGLRVFPQIGKLLDPRTGYTIAYEPGVKYQVDLKAGKIYRDQTEVKIEREEKVRD